MCEGVERRSRSASDVSHLAGQRRQLRIFAERDSDCYSEVRAARQDMCMFRAYTMAMPIPITNETPGQISNVGLQFMNYLLGHRCDMVLTVPAFFLVFNIYF